MFGIGETELVIIVVFAFMLFGPDKLPGMGRTIGRALRQFREAQEGFTEVVQAEVVDPMTSAMSEPGKKKRTVDQAVLDDDADIEGGEEQARSKKGETFAERKARLKAEREAREAAEREEAEAAAARAAAGENEEASDGDQASDEGSSAGPDAQAQEPEEAKPTTAAALYAMAPRKREKKAEEAEAASEVAPESDDQADVVAADADGKEDGEEA